MDLVAISSAATIALASTILILLAVKFWHLVTLPFASASSFRHCIMVESAQRFRDELRRLDKEKTLYVTLSLMFVVTFGVSFLLRPQDTFGALPTSQSIVVLAAVVIAASYGLYRVVRIIIDRQRVAFVRDANIAIGHGLQKLTASQNRVFHEVPCAEGIIDNVAVSLRGVYTVSVIAERPRKDNRIRLTGDELSFAPGKRVVSVTDCRLQAKQLSTTLRKKTGLDIQVRSIIAVPGWEVESQTNENYLVVNERTLTMMLGWTNDKDHLLNEEVEKIDAFLSLYGSR